MHETGCAAYPVTEESGGGVMKVVVWKSPKIWVPFLRRFFKIRRDS